MFEGHLRAKAGFKQISSVLQRKFFIVSLSPPAPAVTDYSTHSYNYGIVEKFMNTLVFGAGFLSHACEKYCDDGMFHDFRQKKYDNGMVHDSSDNNSYHEESVLLMMVLGHIY